MMFGGPGGPGGAGACFGAGTRIATLRGEIPVEDVTDRDHVIDPSGEAIPVVWVGWRRILAAGLEGEEVRPIRIRPDALWDGAPKRDLYVSAGHALLVDGLLVGAGDLVNGLSITRCDDVSEFVYYHVELPRHGLLMAEGAPAESYLETRGNRAFFANAPNLTTFKARPPESAGAWVLGPLGLPDWLVGALAGTIVHRLARKLAGPNLMARLGMNHLYKTAAGRRACGGRAVQAIRRRLAARAAALSESQAPADNVRLSA